MSGLKRGLDAATVLSPYAGKIAAAGFDAVGRYLKSLTKAEVAALHGYGLGVWLIFETTATRALSGATGGNIDGRMAVSQARALGAPPGTAIYATVDTDVVEGGDEDRDGLADSEEVADYFVTFLANVRAAQYRLGGYADGVVLKENSASIELPWLAGAMGWGGSRDFLASGTWAMRQGPQINAGHTATWAGVHWPSLPFAYDPNLIARDDVGLWVPDRMPNVVSPFDKIKAIQLVLGVEQDGAFGRRSRTALTALLQAAGQPGI